MPEIHDRLEQNKIDKMQVRIKAFRTIGTIYLIEQFWVYVSMALCYSLKVSGLMDRIDVIWVCTRYIVSYVYNTVTMTMACVTWYLQCPWTLIVLCYPGIRLIWLSMVSLNIECSITFFSHVFFFYS